MNERYKITKMKIVMFILNFILVGTVLDCNASDLSTIDHCTTFTHSKSVKALNFCLEDIADCMDDNYTLNQCKIVHTTKRTRDKLKTHIVFIHVELMTLLANFTTN